MTPSQLIGAQVQHHQSALSTNATKSCTAGHKCRVDNVKTFPRNQSVLWLTGKNESCTVAHNKHGDFPVAFVHINKAGGTSIASALNHCVEPERSFYRGPDHLHHHTVLDYKRMNITKNWDTVFSFAVVRDPFARMVSLFHYQLEKCLRDRHVTQDTGSDCLRAYGMPNFEEMEKLKRPIETTNHSNPDHIGHHFLRWLRIRDNFFGENAPKFSGMEKNNMYRQDASQISWLVNEENSLGVSLVMRLEGSPDGGGIEAIWLSEVGRCLPKCVSHSLGHEKRSVHSSIRKYYEFFSESADIIRRRMALDFDILEYPRYPNWRLSYVIN